MPARFARLRISGFKSFADPTTIDILPGLTGIIGPNGCGKSNVVDALRWAMGEASAKSLRGGEMEDVIFAGTMARAARNLAEVSITLTDTAGLAPVPFQNEPELQVSRKIERGSGSAYRINGREVRARDVATLFADLASGARNSAMISQGRVSALVNARPDERRALLEEAAGITGLHARRHEAELKLRAAEQNLLRADDLRAQQESRLADLRKQARQANRYRNISGLIRDAEAEYLAIERELAERRRRAARAQFAEAEAAVGRAEKLRDDVLGRETSQNDALPALRAREAETRTRLERARILAEQIDAEIARLEAARREAEARVETLRKDHAGAERIAHDAEAAAIRLDAERSQLAADHERAPARIEQARREAEAASAALAQRETEAQEATEAAARAQAQRQAMETRLTQARGAAGQADRRAREAEAAHSSARAALVSPTRLAAAEAAREAAEQAVAASESAYTEAQNQVQEAEARRAEAHAAALLARTAATEADGAAARLKAETDALRALLAQKFGRDPDPVLDRIKVPAGLETALGAALGAELSAGEQAGAARHWRALPPLASDAALPRIGEAITAPESLRRALDHIFLLPDGEDGDALQAALRPGQSLVSIEGGVWRWDGFVVRPGAPTEAAVRLAQRNRLDQLDVEFERARESAEAARAALHGAETAERDARRAEDEARTARRATESAIDRARKDLRAAVETASRLAAEAERLAAREGAAAETRARIETEASEARAALAAIEAEFATLDDAGNLRQDLDRARAALTESRRRDSDATQALQRLRSETEARARRLETIIREQADWAERARDANDRRTDLAARLHEAEASLVSLGTDGGARERRVEAGAELEAADSGHRAAARDLTAAEESARRNSAAARAAEQDLAQAREARITAESAVREADHAWGTVAERVLERIGVDPALPDVADPSPDAADKARKRFERLARERDEMGPVNLRADIEVGEIETRLAAIERDRDEITSAIAKLRGSIGHLNREGRERLSAVFTEIDRHFQALFTRMFGGGRAHLALTGSDDPLEAGLEIFAEPPGKKLATLSLLSGGEQALTALSLIFAVFRCNPAPLSVLDEVDAPLDDANVERFCRLLEDISQDTGTRFIVVTHHHHTMARMDRLYGVTMQERGISRVLSVDLGTAAAMVEPAGAIAAE